MTETAKTESINLAGFLDYVLPKGGDNDEVAFAAGVRAVLTATYGETVDLRNEDGNDNEVRLIDDEIEQIRAALNEDHPYVIEDALNFRLGFLTRMVRTRAILARELAAIAGAPSRGYAE